MISGENNQIAELFVGVLTFFLASLSGWFVYDKKKARETLDSHSERITKIEAEMLTERDAKQLINESLEPFKEDFEEVKEHMKKMADDMLHIRLAMAKSSGYIQAKEDTEK